MINMKSMGVLYSSSTKKNALHKKQIKNLILINEVFNAVFSLSSFIYSALGDKPRLG